MFNQLSYLFLQQYWWIIISLLGGILAFLLFIQGGQTLIRTIGKTEVEKDILVNILGRKWELGFTTLVTFGGAAFAAFPLFYSTSFGGAYWLWIAILFCFTIQAVSYEFRNKKGNVIGKNTYEAFLAINGSFGVILLGVAIATFFTGSEFYIDELKRSYWQNAFHGLENIPDFTNLSLGFTLFFLARILGAQYFIMMTDNKDIQERSYKIIKQNIGLFLAFFLYFIFNLLTNSGFAYDQETKLVYAENNKYLHNLIEIPFIGTLFLIGVILVVIGIYLTIFLKHKKAMYYTGIGTTLTVFTIIAIAGLNNTVFYPSITDFQSSLTIENASSGKYTLTTMGYVSLIIPFILAYIIYVWRLMDKKKITEEEIKKIPESY